MPSSLNSSIMAIQAPDEHCGNDSNRHHQSKDDAQEYARQSETPILKNLSAANDLSNAKDFDTLLAFMPGG